MSETEKVSRLYTLLLNHTVSGKLQWEFSPQTDILSTWCHGGYVRIDPDGELLLLTEAHSAFASIKPPTPEDGKMLRTAAMRSVANGDQAFNEMLEALESL